LWTPRSEKMALQYKTTHLQLVSDIVDGNRRLTFFPALTDKIKSDK